MNCSESVKSGSATFLFFRRIYPFLKRYRTQCLTALAALFAVHVVEAFIPFFLKAGIDSIAKKESNILEPLVAMLGLTLLRFVTLNFGRRRNALVSVSMSSDLRQALYEHLQVLGHGFYASYRIGDLMARATNDIAAIQRFFRFAVHQLLSMVSMAAIAPIFMAVQSLELTLMLLPMLLTMAVAGWYWAKRIRIASEHVQTGYGELTEALQQNLKGIRTIQSHAQEDREICHFTQNSKRYAATCQQLARWNTAFAATMVLGCGLLSLIVVGIGGQHVLAGQMSIGTLAAFILYLGMILEVIKNSSQPVYSLLNASTAGARVFGIMDERPEIDDTQATTAMSLIRGEISVRDLWFEYPSSRDPRPILKGISLTIQPGETVAFIGRIGAGKSTFLKLLARQLEPSTGLIALDGQDLRSIPLKDLRYSLSFVTQDSFLFAASISENISFDDPNRPPERIWTAARVAQLEATIKNFDEGLSTRIGERGVTFSGGQKQRTHLARGLIRETPILLLDDSFSALDAETTAQILAQLRSLRHQLTTVMVSHRVATVRQADRIYVLEQGCIVEEGTHNELIANNGYYADLIRTHDQRSVPDRSR